MAAITTAGKVTCKEGTEAVTVREFGNGGKIAKFNMVDQEYYYAKSADDKIGQFYTCEVNGKQADIVVDRLQRGDRVCVRGQLVQREYNGKIYLDVKNASVTFMEDRRDTQGGGSDSLF